MASTELKRTISSAGSQTKWGASAWVKRCDLGLSAGVYCSSKSDTTQNNRGIFFNSSDQIECAFYNGGYTYQVVTNRLFRDTSAFYHVVVNLDTSQTTAADRIKIWVNGVQETSFATSNYPGQGSTHNFLGTDITQLVASLREGSSIHHSCIIAHLHFTDGYCYPASTFGETDATTGIWKPKISPSGVTYGTNGFFLKFDNSANMGLDSAGSNNLTTSSGTIIQSKETPSNIFCNLNLLNRINEYSITNVGSTFTNISSGNHRMTAGTLAASSGKYYAEVKVVAVGGTYPQIGIIDPGLYAYDSHLGNSNKGYGYLSNGNKQVNGTATSFGNSYTDGDIIGIAMDLDNSKLYFSKNGTFQNSGVPTSGSTGTGAIAFTAGSVYTFGQSAYNSGTFSWNFGNGFFGTSAVASAQSPDDGTGVFEYDVPAGYRALCTKSINEEEYS